MNYFLFGVGTASHQNEGNNNNNWNDWEIKNNLERSGIACNSWTNYRDDIQKIKEINCNAYRFSLEWSRICPSENQVDISAIKHYNTIIEECLINKIEPIVTLHHFTRPLWFDKKYGGLHSSFFIIKFLDYIKQLTNYLGEKIKYIITFNEPVLECLNGYIRGTRPPGYKNDFDNMFKALCNVLTAHAATYKLLKNRFSNIKISFSKNIVHFKKQYTYNIVKNYLETSLIDSFNWNILNAVFTGEFSLGINIPGIIRKFTKTSCVWKDTIDFLAINHYNVGYFKINFLHKNPIDIILNNPSCHTINNILDWEVDKKSMGVILDKIHTRYGCFPVMITENGACGEHEEDTEGQKLILYNHLASIVDHHTIHNNIIGYIWWTLQDNFEWDDGYAPKFGLYTRVINYDGTITKKIKQSGNIYRDLVKTYNNSINSNRYLSK
jgi:beta-glucosidase